MFNQHGLGDLEMRHSSELWTDGDCEVCPIFNLTSGSRSIVENSSREYLLHPEMRKNDEIVAEVFSTSLKQCESARQHVLAFLAGASLRADHPVGSSFKKKEIRVPSKILLQLKPKNSPSKQTN
ncbi:hypothetical protein KIN20_022845 [Parelaphostrongylus tenuis]|uniref:Uncharacterized protein n=1 Tax=Parelaphostrongylus tenuis TaxID=148309 RepID=A0AAD5MQU5_PARTN|nr:hypothetical protein KIN20_022845 [Parelaphostrongylus tenuis]